MILDFVARRPRNHFPGKTETSRSFTFLFLQENFLLTEIMCSYEKVRYRGSCLEDRSEKSNTQCSM